MSTGIPTDAYLDDLRARQAKARQGRQPAATVHPAGELTLPAHVARWAVLRPERPALVAADETLSYRELDDRAARLAGWLTARGVRPGDRVGVFLPNGARFVVALLAVLRLGAVHVPVNPMFRAAELRHELRDAGPEVIVTQDALVPVLDEVRHETPVRTVLADADWPAATAHPRHEPIADDLDALAALNYTGGTTGLPKGCEHTQRHMVYTATAIDNGRMPDAAEQERGIVSVCFLPVFWIAGENLGILAPLVSGGTSVLLARWDAGEVLRAIETHGATTMAGTVENYLELLDHPDLARRDLSTLTAPLTVSFIRKLTPALRARWKAAVGARSVLREASYGMTETHTSDTNTLGFQDADHDLLSDPVFCGLPVPGTDFMVVDFATGTPLPLGERGEIVVRGPSVLTRYWRAPEATESALRDGWLHTGDIGALDEEGALHYLGRDKDMIKVKGMSVFPTEVETLLAHHPDVLAAAVVAVPDDASGERPYAFVRTAPGSPLTGGELREWAAATMATYKVPAVVEVVAELPLTPTGKIRKTELTARASRTRPAP
ncbi:MULTISPECIES: AMP-binding protein [unclassified Streptomyces]|uniref:AMP-binding protein n=1 Tax=unclassified Streptomyces TaxID=2593676 RepID=UPI000DBA0C1B|nr:MULTISPECIES: AMP-binding protein [unclassified Streptomyces]MYT75496.1 AMP-binding protein [Streptomyces sp. SID8367]RAJ86901.1 fatty-acyl-CoA synthase/long-chain acyl-CoA synthetase [Streptomyces sp. PsTaAH-137]